MGDAPATWHYGLVARWWAEFNRDGPEIDYFRRFVEAGQPALDVGCGTGRLLLPYLRDGLDVDGCDVSPDMIALCREQAAREGLAPTLFVTPMHELSPPRRYRTIYVCGALGLGSTRAQDQEALSRFFDALEPGGTLVLDNEAPYADAVEWAYWPAEERRALPEARSEPGERRRTSDGSELALRARTLALDPLEQTVTYEMHAYEWRDGELVAEEEHRLTLGLYFRNELVLMLERAGFVDVSVRGGYDDGPPTPEHRFLVFVARKPAGQSARNALARSSSSVVASCASTRLASATNPAVYEASFRRTRDASSASSNSSVSSPRWGTAAFKRSSCEPSPGVTRFPRACRMASHAQMLASWSKTICDSGLNPVLRASRRNVSA